MKRPFDISYLTFVAIQAALQAGDILRKGFMEELSITAKPGHQNIVTQYDYNSEKAIISTIKEHFPSHRIIAEESGLSDALNSSDQITWIIDPLDGTVNFAHGIPIFTISIAAYNKEEGLCGVIYQPITNELFIAEKNKGAYLNGIKITVSTTHTLKEAVLGIGFPYDAAKRSGPYLNRFTALVQSGASFRNLGSAALALAYVAAGKLDGFWIDHLYSWDLAAGKILIHEAGGIVSHYDNSAIEIEVASNALATNQALHPILINNLK